MEEMPVTRKIGLIYVIIGFTYFILFGAMTILFPVSESSHSGDAAIMVVFLALVSVPIIVSGLLINKKKRTLLVIVTAILFVYASRWFFIIFSLDSGGIIAIVYFISQSLVPGFLAIFNFFLIDKQFEVSKKEPIEKFEKS